MKGSENPVSCNYIIYNQHIWVEVTAINSEMRQLSALQDGWFHPCKMNEM